MLVIGLLVVIMIYGGYQIRFNNKVGIPTEEDEQIFTRNYARDSGNHYI